MVSSPLERPLNKPDHSTQAFQEVVLSVFLELLLGKLVSSPLNFIADSKQVHKQLKEWKSKLPCIQAVLTDSKEKQFKNKGVRNWLADLQDLAYDVDDILDEFAYEALRLKLQKKLQLMPALVRYGNSFLPAVLVISVKLLCLAIG